MERINQYSRGLQKKLDSMKAEIKCFSSLNTQTINKQETLEQYDIFSTNIGNSKSKTDEQNRLANEEFQSFFND